MKIQWVIWSLLVKVSLGVNRMDDSWVPTKMLMGCFSVQNEEADLGKSGCRIWKKTLGRCTWGTVEKQQTETNCNGGRTMTMTMNHELIFSEGTVEWASSEVNFLRYPLQLYRRLLIGASSAIRISLCCDVGCRQNWLSGGATLREKHCNPRTTYQCLYWKFI